MKVYFPIILSVFLLFLIPMWADEGEYIINQKDIDEFLEYIEDYLPMAGKFVDTRGDVDLNVLYYESDSEELLLATKIFIENHDWTIEQFGDFIGKVAVAFSAMELIQDLGEEFATEAIDGEVLTIAEYELIKLNAGDLAPFFYSDGIRLPPPRKEKARPGRPGGGPDR